MVCEASKDKVKLRLRRRRTLAKVVGLATTMCALFLLWTLALTTATDGLVLNKFGSKNTYNASRLNSSNSDDDDLIRDPNCKLLQVIALMRHGIRYPGADDLELVPTLTRQFRSRGANSVVVDQLDAVVSKCMPTKMDKELSVTGAEEQLGIGARVARRFSKLFTSVEDVSFVASSSTRAKESCGNFSKGFDEVLGFSNPRSIETRDDLLRFFEKCQKYVKTVRKNKTALYEETLFKNLTIPELSISISKHLNISELNLTADDLDSIYKVAACEVAIVGSHHWTDILSVPDLDFLEYSDDLQQYWKIGYGYPINYQQSCPLLVDIFQHMDDVISGKRTKKGVFYFGHAETILPLASLLGLYNDSDTLRADNYARQHQRAFKSSRISPFSANLGFALYKCNAEGTVVLNNGYMVQVLYNEQPIQLPHVCAGSMCSYTDLRNHYSQFIDHCNFDEICSLSGSANVPCSSVRIFVLLALFLLLVW